MNFWIGVLDNDIMHNVLQSDKSNSYDFLSLLYVINPSAVFIQKTWQVSECLWVIKINDISKLQQEQV